MVALTYLYFYHQIVKCIGPAVTNQYMSRHGLAYSQNPYSAFKKSLGSSLADEEYDSLELEDMYGTYR